MYKKQSLNILQSYLDKQKDREMDRLRPYRIIPSSLDMLGLYQYLDVSFTNFGVACEPSTESEKKRKVISEEHNSDNVDNDL